MGFYYQTGAAARNRPPALTLQQVPACARPATAKNTTRDTIAACLITASRAFLALLGFLVGLLLGGLLLGVRLHRHDPGLWTVRFDRGIGCGLDYNGPPYAPQVTLWLTCGEADGWQVWPLER